MSGIECELARMTVPIERFPFLDRFAYRKISFERVADLALRMTRPDESRHQAELRLYVLPSVYSRPGLSEIFCFSMICPMSLVEDFSRDYQWIGSFLADQWLSHHNARRDAERAGRLEST